MPRIHTVAADGTITSQDKLIGSDGAQNADFVTRNYTVGGITDFIIGGAHHGKFITLTTTGNATIGGDVTIAGNITVGDADTDTISFAADVISNIIPDVTNTYDIGSSTKEWKDIHLSGSARAGGIWLDGTLNEISGVTNMYAQKYFDSQDSTYFLDPSGSISLKVKGSIQLGDANAETNAEITSYGDLILKADVDNDGNYTRGEEIFRARGGNDGGTNIDINKSQYDLNGAAIASNAFETIQVGDVIHGLGGGANYTTVTSATVSSITGWTNSSDELVQAAVANPPEAATKLTLVMNTSISYSNNAYLTILPSGSTFNEDATRNIKFFSGNSQVASIDKDGKLTVSAIDAGSSAITTTGALNVGSVVATGTIVANNTDTINGININNSNQEMSGIGEIYANKYFDGQDANYYLDPGHAGVSIKVAGKIEANNTDTINGININSSNQEISGVGEIYAHKFIDSQTGTHYLDPGNSTLSLVTAGKATIGAFTIPKTIGSAGQVLKVPSSGSELEWSNDLQSTASASVGSGSNTVPSSADDFVVNINSVNGGMTVVTQDGTNAGNGPEFRLATHTQQNAYILDYDEATENVRMQRHGAYFLKAGATEVNIFGKLRVGNGDETAESSSDALIVNEGASNTGMSILNGGDASNGYSRLTLGRDGDTDAYHINYANSSDSFEIRKDSNLQVKIAPNGPSNVMMVDIGALLKLSSVSTFADDTAAGTGGLTSGMVYKKSDGTLMIKS